MGWDYQEKVEKHESQMDYTKGFGGKFGLQTDRQDVAAVGFDEEQGHVGTIYEKDKPVVTGNRDGVFLVHKSIILTTFVMFNRERQSLPLEIAFRKYGRGKQKVSHGKV